MNARRLVAITLTAFVLESALADMTIFIVRHAGKNTPKATAEDLPLSEAGVKRADELKHALSAMKFDAIFATQLQRTQQTVAPVATAAGITTSIYQAGESAGLAEDLKKNHADHTVLVAGHGNTIPALLSALGVKETVAVADVNHDDLYIVTVRNDGSVQFLNLHYGDAAD